MNYRTIAAILLSVMLLSACQSAGPDPADPSELEAVDNQEREPAQPVVTDGEPGAGVPGESVLEEGTSFPADAYAGEVPGISFGIGHLTKDLILELGEPERMDYFAGGLYFAYSEVVFFTDAVWDNDDNLVDGSIRRMGFAVGSSVFGIEIGQTFAEIATRLEAESTLHSPDDNGSNEFYEDEWSLEYEIGKYRLVFTAETEDGPTHAAYFEEMQ
ncbi:DUF4309 domain-containing protein [Paenibacillaceae bacterium]|nr:DUF4309 domain-containing protein [Paenibacillaceae bacterium]